MYLKPENLTLVLIFDTLEHFRCFAGDRGTGAFGDGRHHRASADPRYDDGRD